MVKKLTAKLDGGKVKDQFASLSPPTLDVSGLTILNLSMYCILGEAPLFCAVPVDGGQCCNGLVSRV